GAGPEVGPGWQGRSGDRDIGPQSRRGSPGHDGHRQSGRGWGCLRRKGHQANVEDCARAEDLAGIAAHQQRDNHVRGHRCHHRRSHHAQRPCVRLLHPGLLAEQHPRTLERDEPSQGPRVPAIATERRRRPRDAVAVWPSVAAALQLPHHAQDRGGLQQLDVALRILAIDPGTVRLGLALSDPSGTIAQPLSVLARRSEPEDLKALSELVERHEVGMIVIGLPRLMDGRLDAAAHQAQAFGTQVARATGRPVAYWDERLTSVAAERYLIEQGKRRNKRRQEIDRMAATLLLQGYLDYRAGRGPGG